MFPLSLHLGSIKVSATDSATELNATTSIELSSSVPLDSARNGPRAIDLLTAREIWVERGVGCCLAVQLRVNGERPQDEVWRAETAEGLGQVLREAELWEQLQLHVSLSIPSSPTSSPDIDQEDITINIRGPKRFPHGAQDPQSTAESGHRYVSQARPSNGFPCAGINIIRIKLDFCQRDAGSRAKRLKINTEHSFEPLIKEPPSFDHVRSLLLSWRSSVARDVSDRKIASILAQLKPLIKKPPSFDHVRSLLLSWQSSVARDVSDRKIASILAQLEKLVAAATDVVSSSGDVDIEPAGLRRGTERQAVGSQGRTENSSGDGSSSPLKRPFPEDDQYRQDSLLTTHLDLPTVVALTDAAFRSLISYRPNKYPGNAVSRRAPFVSTISRALSSISGRCQSSSLRKKLEELSRRPASSVITAGEETPSPAISACQASVIQTTVQSRLWRLLQQRLYEPGAALLLKPLKVAGDREDFSASMVSESNDHQNGNEDGDDEMAEGSLPAESLVTPPPTQFINDSINSQHLNPFSPMEMEELEMEEFLDELDGSNSVADSEISFLIENSSQTQYVGDDIQEDTFSSPKETTGIEITSSPPPLENNIRVDSNDEDGMDDIFDLANRRSSAPSLSTTTTTTTTKRPGTGTPSTISSLVEDYDPALGLRHIEENERIPSTVKTSSICSTMVSSEFDHLEMMMIEEEHPTTPTRDGAPSEFDREISDLEEEKQEEKQGPHSHKNSDPASSLYDFIDDDDELDEFDDFDLSPALPHHSSVISHQHESMAMPEVDSHSELESELELELELDMSELEEEKESN
ncbi:MAG: hypothetical protein M1823_002788 [Watsoniomyces obsoletus]|nr:MAG: hypothetical protein M1823_002788 [Watsoniomyces obsoletus]